jgi:hypothetical protein
MQETRPKPAPWRSFLRRGVPGNRVGRVRKAFFSEEKKQKTFANGAAHRWRTLRRAEIEVFWFFFSKKNRLASLHQF